MWIYNKLFTLHTCSLCIHTQLPTLLKLMFTNHYLFPFPFLQMRMISQVNQKINPCLNFHPVSQEAWAEVEPPWQNNYTVSKENSIHRNYRKNVNVNTFLFRKHTKTISIPTYTFLNIINTTTFVTQPPLPPTHHPCHQHSHRNIKKITVIFT